jgi:hypothetical protein
MICPHCHRSIAPSHVGKSIASRALVASLNCAPVQNALNLSAHEQVRYRPEPDHWTVLSLTQPWASAMFIPGLKAIETRGWRTNYRGRLYIHAAKGFPRYAKDFAEETLSLPDHLPLGCILGHVDLVDIKRTEDLCINRDGVRFASISSTEEKWGDYGPKRWGWITQNPVLLDEPVPAVGSLGLWKSKESTQCLTKST